MAGAAKFMAKNLVVARLLKFYPGIIHRAGHGHQINIGAGQDQAVRHIRRAQINIDDGTGRPRYMSVFGPESAAAVLREALAPLKDLGMLGANTIVRRQGFSSDYGAFNEAGLPGVYVGQDPIEYNNYTWHSNLDTYERIVEEDVMKSAIVIAATVYHLATRDDLLPRFSQGDMPKRPNTR